MESKTIFRELQKLIEGETLFDELSRTIYSSAASLYRVKPFGIVQPRHKKDVITVVKYAGRRGIPLTPRGGGRVGRAMKWEKGSFSISPSI